MYLCILDHRKKKLKKKELYKRKIEERNKTYCIDMSVLLHKEKHCNKQYAKEELNIK